MTQNRPKGPCSKAASSPIRHPRTPPAPHDPAESRYGSSLEIIGHRGYPAVAPENTLASLEAALAAGGRSVEFDLHVASCGTPVLFHDTSLARTTDGLGMVSRHSLAQLQTLDAGKWFAPEFAGEKIPSFAEALAALKGRVYRIYPEIKGFRDREDLDRMVRLVGEAGLSASTTFISLDWNSLDHIRSQDSDLGIGFIVDAAERCDEALERAMGHQKSILDLSHKVALEDRSTIERARQKGIDVAVWTVNDPLEATRLRETGVTRFTTDKVRGLMDWCCP